MFEEGRKIEEFVGRIVEFFNDNHIDTIFFDRYFEKILPCRVSEEGYSMFRTIFE